MLVVEDDDDLRLLYSMFLSLRGFEVRSAADGQAGYEEVIQNRPDVILTDIAMPRLDGLQLLSRIKGEKSFGILPVIVMSAYGKQRLAIAEQMGADLILEKPLDDEVLYQAVQQVLPGVGPKL